MTKPAVWIAELAIGALRFIAVSPAIGHRPAIVGRDRASPWLEWLQLRIGHESRAIPALWGLRRAYIVAAGSTWQNGLKDTGKVL